jgi:predicted transposase YdaD
MKPYDVTSKYLIRNYSKELLAWSGIHDVQQIQIVDTDVSAVSAAVDAVLDVVDTEHYIVHWEFQAVDDPQLESRLYRYSGLLAESHQLPVLTILVLLRRFSGWKQLTGRFEMKVHGEITGTLSYRVLRAWELDAKQILSQRQVGLIPFLFLAVKKSEVKPLVEQTEAIIKQTLTVSQQADFWVCAGLFMTSKFPMNFIQQVIGGAKMKGSALYEAILQEGIEKGRVEGMEKGRAEGMRDDTIRLIKIRFKRVPVRLTQKLENVHNLSVLEQIFESAAKAENLRELSQKIDTTFAATV